MTLYSDRTQRPVPISLFDAIGKVVDGTRLRLSNGAKIDFEREALVLESTEPLTFAVDFYGCSWRATDGKHFAIVQLEGSTQYEQARQWAESQGGRVLGSVVELPPQGATQHAGSKQLGGFPSLAPEAPPRDQRAEEAAKLDEAEAALVVMTRHNDALESAVAKARAELTSAEAAFLHDSSNGRGKVVVEAQDALMLAALRLDRLRQDTSDLRARAARARRTIECIDSAPRYDYARKTA